MNTMNEVIAEQTTRLKMAKIRAQAEAQVMRQMLPEDVQSELHYNGKDKAIQRYPEFRNAIEAIYA